MSAHFFLSSNTFSSMSGFFIEQERHLLRRVIHHIILYRAETFILSPEFEFER